MAKAKTRSVTLIGTALILSLASGCMGLHKYNNSRTPDWIAERTKTKRDNFKKLIEVTGPRIGGVMPGGFSAGTFKAHFRAWTFEKPGMPDTFQLYIATDHTGRWHHYSSAHDDSGLALKTTKIASEPDCSRSTCRYREDVGVSMSRSFLNSKRESGIHMKVSGSGGELIIQVPGPWITGFLDRFDVARSQWKSRPSENSSASHSAPAANVSSKWFKIKSDRNANYRIASTTQNRSGHLVAISERRGSSGTSWTEREIDCKTGRVRYTREGNTLDGLKGYRTPAEMRVPVWESITGQVVLRLCPSLRRRASRY